MAKIVEGINVMASSEASLNTMFDSSQDEEEYAAKMDELDEVFETYDKICYQLAMDGTEIQDKILTYLQSNIDEFFEITPAVL